MTTTSETIEAVPATSQHETVIQAVVRTYHAVVRPFERHVGMGKIRWQILAQLSRNSEMSQAELQQRLRVDGAAITRHVKQLEEDGIVVRRPDPQDNRYTLVTLTEAGSAQTEGMAEKRESFEALATAGLTPDEIALLRRCLQQVRDNMRDLGAGE